MPTWISMKTSLSLTTLVLAFATALVMSQPVTADDGLPAPDDVAAEARSTSQIHVSWDRVWNASSYIVLRESDNGDSQRQVEDTSSTHYEDTNVHAGVTYTYVIKAKKDDKLSSASRPAHATVPLPAPENVNATAASSSSIRIEWDRVWGASSYIVKRSDDSYGSYREIDTTSSTGFTDTSLRADTTYYYVIVAKSSSDAKSAESHAAHATTTKP